jgi:hypothetical protein
MTLWNWLIKNLSNVFSFIGILLTIYFGVYYIPSYVTSLNQEKINIAKKDVIITIQELLFNKGKIDLTKIEKIIRGKELQYQIEIPDSLKEIVLQTEATIYDQKYLNLNTRLEVIARLDSLSQANHSTTSDTSNTKVIQKQSIYSNFLSILIAIISFLITSIAVISFIKKLKKEKENEVMASISEKEDEILETAQNAIEFETRIMGLVDKIHNEHAESRFAVASGGDRGWDFRIDNRGVTFLAEIKYLPQRTMNVTIIDKLFNSMKTMKAQGIIITNGPIGRIAHTAINSVNDKSAAYKISVIDSDYEAKIRNIIYAETAT